MTSIRNGKASHYNQSSMPQNTMKLSKYCNNDEKDGESDNNDDELDDDESIEDSNGLESQFDCEILDLDEDIGRKKGIENNSTDYEKRKMISHEENCKEEKLGIDNCVIPATGPNGKKISVLLFSVEALLRRDSTLRLVGSRYNLMYKCNRSDSKLIRTILNAHGFRECPTNSTSNDFNILWTGSHVRPYSLRTMTEYQKVNHFPRSFELTRKDRLYKNIQRMQLLRGMRHFDIVPPSFLVPSEFQELCQHSAREKGPYIVKPVALSRGRGIFLCNHPNQIPLDEQLIVSKYINNPYLIDGLKFDIRLYVVVTSYDPLVAYLYEEGLTRFATVKYQNTTKHLRSQCMHLTNYSVNKKNNSFIQNDDANVENIGNKWSLGALLRHLRKKDVDTTCLMMKIEDIIIKSLIAAEPSVSMACRTFQTYRGNCFELYGYDIIIDENLRPWLLEVNLSPSLSCDSPLDFKIKSHMLSDMFSLVGVACQDPQNIRPSTGTSSLMSGNRRVQSAVKRCPSSIGRGSTNNSSLRRPCAGLRRRDGNTQNGTVNQAQKTEENRLIRRIKEENRRRGGWIRIFPAPESMDTYGLFLSVNNSNSQANCTDYNSSVYSNQGSYSINKMVHFRLYPERYTTNTVANNNHSDQSTLLSRQSPTFHNYHSTNSINNKARPSLHSVNMSSKFHRTTLTSILPANQIQYQKISQNYADTQMRVPFYERKLGEDPLVNADIQDDDGTHETTNGVIRKNKENLRKIQDTKSSNGYSGTSKRHVSSTSSLSSPLSSADTSCTTSSTSSLASDISDNHEDDENTRNTRESKQNIILNSGHLLTQIQARHSFSHYLSRVQSRLILESHNTNDNSDYSTTPGSSNQEQLDLVLRFLRRASTNIPPNENFTVPQSIPHKDSTPLHKQQQYLARLLGTFINIYSRETALAEKQQNSKLNSNSKESYVSNKTFFNFLRNATEHQLEKLLSDYTKINKSAGIFLNPNIHQSVIITGTLPNNLKKSSSLTNLSQSPKSTTNPIRQSITQPLERPRSGSSSNNLNYRTGSTKLGFNHLKSSNSVSNPLQTPEPVTSISRTLQKLAQDHRNRQLTASLSSLRDASNNSIPSSSGSASAAGNISFSQNLLRQYSQSKQLLQDSKAKHNALLMKHDQNPNTSSSNSNVTTANINLTNSNSNKPPPSLPVNSNNQLVNKPPPGIRTFPNYKYPSFSATSKRY